MFDLTPYNTFGLHVHSKNGIIINTENDLKTVHEDEIIILGHGSDVRFTDDYDGTVLINKIKSLNITQEGDFFKVKVGSGVILDDLIESLLENKIYGLENLSAIPGTVGAAPIQNVGAYGVEIGDLITEIEAYDLQRHFKETFSHERCEFAYRSSYFKHHCERKLFITSVTFRLFSRFIPKLTYQGLKNLHFKDGAALRARIEKMRSAKLPDPKLIGNAGSFFKNPEIEKEVANKLKEQYPDMPVYPTNEAHLCKLAAGWLIEKAGCRGITHGNVGTWEEQALVIVNRGDAKPNEVVALAQYIIAEVYAKFGILLVPEVRTYGPKGELSWKRM